MRIRSWMVAMGLVLTGLAASTAHARTSVPIVNHENLAIVLASGRQPSAEQVKQAISAAAASTRYPWMISEEQPGTLIATTLVRGKHTVVVNIVYSLTRYSVTYRDSNNMNYKNDHGVPKIHPNYNVWVQELVSAINSRLLAL